MNNHTCKSIPVYIYILYIYTHYSLYYRLLQIPLDTHTLAPAPVGKISKYCETKRVADNTAAIPCLLQEVPSDDQMNTPTTSTDVNSGKTMKQKHGNTSGLLWYTSYNQ